MPVLCPSVDCSLNLNKLYKTTATRSCSSTGHNASHVHFLRPDQKLKVYLDFPQPKLFDEQKQRRERGRVGEKKRGRERGRDSEGIHKSSCIIRHPLGLAHVPTARCPTTYANGQTLSLSLSLPLSLSRLVDHLWAAWDSFDRLLVTVKKNNRETKINGY